MRSFGFSIILIFAVLLLYACGVHKNAGSGLQTHVQVNEAPAIAFLFFKIKKEPNNNLVTLQELRIKEGHLKPAFNTVRNKNFVLIAGVYAGDKLLYEEMMNHPLYEIAEVNPSQNHLQTVMQSLSEANFIFRIKRDKNITQIKFREIVQGAHTDLNTIEIKF